VGLLGEHHEHGDTAARFRWREAAGYLHIPILQKLFYDFANPAQLGALRLDEVLDWAGEALNRVDRASFFASFEQHHAVQYFYEPFLEAFDPELRKELGVWYTPPEIVTYMVERVDQVLRSELDIPDGLADPRVVVLDPCCGTGAYLVEVLDRIARTLRERGDDALLAHDLKEAAKSRVYGFEILPAPFVISHLQIGMLLHRLGAPLSDADGERAGVYLTNALTGWEPPTEPKQHLLFTEMEEERDKAEHVKQHAPILVILGNPPYNGHPGVAVEEERDLSTAYRTVKSVAAPQGRGLNDLYVRFFRMAERRITEGSDRIGIVCFISNYSWLNGLSFTGMRERYLGVFKRAWIDNLHGDRIISEYAPDGATSETVFALSGKSPGIKIGTAIALLCATQAERPQDCEVAYRDFTAARAEARRADLLRSLHGGDPYALVEPAPSIGLPFTPQAVTLDYLTWPRLTELLPVLSPGVMTSRDSFVVDIDRETLEARVRRYFNPQVEDSEVAATDPVAMRDTGRFQAKATRQRLLARGFLRDKIVRYSYRPFDVRWLYWEPEGKLLDEKRAEYFSSVFSGNLALVAQQKPRREWSKPQVIGSIGCLDLMDRGASCLPVYLTNVGGQSLFDSAGATADGPIANLTDDARTYVGGLGSTPESIAFSAVSILHAPTYSQENLGALQQDWPRVPLPATLEALRASAMLGRRVAALLDVETPVDAVTTGKVRRDLSPLGVLSSVSGGQLDPATGDLAVSSGWGHAGRGGVTMPGKGRAAERPYTGAELAAFREGLADLGLSYDQFMACLGGACYDVYLNERAYWRCVPARVWTYTIGGYQVMKKWLSYRERPLLGRDLTPEEARYVTEMARRIAAIVLLQPALDANYERVKADTYSWPESP
jgi:predicted helicase